MIDPTSLKRFLSGRIVGLGMLFGFQILIVRLLSPTDYARYALVIALAGLVQTITALGLPRVAAKFLSIAGLTLSRPAAKQLFMAMLAIRLLACAGVCFPVLVLVASRGHAAPWPIFGAGVAYTLAVSLQSDADGAAQALRLQIHSRRAAIGEPLIRVSGAIVLAVFWGQRDAAMVLGVSAVTAALASAILICAVLKTLSAGDDAGAVADLNWREVRQTAIGGYGSTLSWLAFSPATVRLIASRTLPIVAFAGFSFVQALVVSAQRYAPSFTLFPLVEPTVMADAARTSRSDGLSAALSLLVKLDVLMVGAASVGVALAGPTLILLLTHGRYNGAAAYLPWLLIGIVANASHRSYEIAAIAMGAAHALRRALALSLLWLAITLWLAPRFGVWPLLLCPLGDSITRFWFVQRALTKQGASEVLDVRGIGLIAGTAVVAGTAGVAVAALVPTDDVARIGLGLAAATVFLVLVPHLRPMRTPEQQVLTASLPWLERLLAPDPNPSQRPVRIVILTPRGRGGTGGVDRLTDSLRPLLAVRNDVQVRVLTTRGSHRWMSLVVSAAAMLRLSVACVQRQADVVHVNLGANGSCYRKIALLAIPRLLGIPYVLHLHGSSFDAFWTKAPPLVRTQIDRLFRGASQVIVLGDIWRRCVTNRLPDIAARVEVLANAAPLFTRPRDLPGAAVRILFLGELSARKGLQVLLEALTLLKTTAPWRITLAGDGDVAGTRLVLERAGVAKQASVTGWVDPAGVEALLAASDILVLPSFEENLPMAVIEAFAAGLAVVATPVGALPDILRHRETGLVVQPGNAEALASALLDLIDDQALRQRLGAEAKAFHAEHLAIEAYVDRLCRLWRSIARSPHD